MYTKLLLPRHEHRPFVDFSEVASMFISVRSSRKKPMAL